MKKNKLMARMIALLCCCAMLVAVLAGCTPNNGQEQLNNQDKSFATIAGWNATGLINHYNSSTGCSAFPIFVVEGLYSYVRTTDEVYCQLAEAMPVHTKEPLDAYKETMGDDMYAYFADQGINEVGVSTVKIRDNAKWSNGDPVTTKDIWAYYYIVHPASSNYMITIHLVDSNTLQFIWNPNKEPVNKVKELLLACDVSGTVHYETFLNFAERCYEITTSWPINTDKNLWGAFNRYPSGVGDTELAIVRDEFYAYNPSWYVSTGPYKLEKFSATQILLTKNEYHWAADQLGFDMVKLYSYSDTNQVYSLLANNTLDYWDGYIVPDTLEYILDSNENIVNVKMYDPGTYGIMFNIESEYLSDIRVRQAINYIFDREKVTEAANPYATASYYPTMGMCPSEASMYMSEEGLAELPVYSKDHAKAEALLLEAGWTKENGVWMKDGKPVELTAGVPNVLISVNAMQAAAAQLEEFGISVELVVSSNFLGEAQSSPSKYDMSLDFNDLNMSFSYPTGSYRQFSNVYARNMHIPRYPSTYQNGQKRGEVQLVFNGLFGDTNTYEFADYINTFYYLEGEELSYMVDVFNNGIADGCYGVQFFENVTSTTLNVSRVDGLAFEEKWSQNRDCPYVPTVGTEDLRTMAKYNLYYAWSWVFINGAYQPK